jgi:sulfatase modifying factor 1
MIQIHSSLCRPPRFQTPIFLLSPFVLAVLSPIVDGGAYSTSTGIEMVQISPGRFTMGQDNPRQTDYMHPVAADKDRGADWDEFPMRETEISKPFFMSAAEITNAQYEAFDPDHRKIRPKRAVTAGDEDAAVNVNWDDATNFCQWLTKKDGRNYRLPTEAEWEYSCRAGTTTLYNMGDTLPDKYQQMNPRLFESFSYWFPDKARIPPYYDIVAMVNLKVRQNKPNAWGLYDMCGNVEQWCADWYAAYDPAETKDPLGPSSGISKVLRGGAHSERARLLRSANRISMFPFVRNVFIGFRIVQADPPPRSSAPNLEFPVQTSTPFVDPSYDSSAPYFRGPIQTVHIPPNSFGPLFSTHNHDNGIACLPDGSIMAVWYSTQEETGTELAVATSRLLPNGQWTDEVPFFDTADGNDHAPALFVDGNRIFHFNGNKNLRGSVVRHSDDNGQTWSPPVLYSDFFTQPNDSTIKLRNGRILATLDGEPARYSVVQESRDDGNTWQLLSTGYADGTVMKPGDTGGMIWGIHTGIVERADGTLLALSRTEPVRDPAFDNKLAENESSDGGRTWTCRISDLPAISSGQRLTLTRLREGPLLVCSFTDRLARQNPQGATIGSRSLADRDGMMVQDGKGGQYKGYGLFAALSWDDGKTWPIRRLILPGILPVHCQATDGRPITLTNREAEPAGYLGTTQDHQGRIHLISSRNHYVFNLAWLSQGKK